MAGAEGLEETAVIYNTVRDRQGAIHEESIINQTYE